MTSAFGGVGSQPMRPVSESARPSTETGMDQRPRAVRTANGRRHAALHLAARIDRNVERFARDRRSGEVARQRNEPVDRRRVARHRTSSGATTADVPMRLTVRPVPQRVSVVRGTGEEPDLYTVDLGAGRSVQIYADPGHPGPNEVHITFVEGRAELPVEAVPSVALDGRALDAKRFGAGHFTAAATMQRGRHAILVRAAPLVARLDIEIR